MGDTNVHRNGFNMIKVVYKTSNSIDLNKKTMIKGGFMNKVLQ